MTAELLKQQADSVTEQKPEPWEGAREGRLVPFAEYLQWKKRNVMELAQSELERPWPTSWTPGALGRDPAQDLHVARVLDAWAAWAEGLGDADLVGELNELLDCYGEFWPSRLAEVLIETICAEARPVEWMNCAVITRAVLEVMNLGDYEAWRPRTRREAKLDAHRARLAAERETAEGQAA